MLLKMHHCARRVNHCHCYTVATRHVCDQNEGRAGWCTQKGESSADGLLVAWLLWPSGPLSSDCHSWGLRERFLQHFHSSKLTPPTKHCLPRPTSHHAICPDRWKDTGLKLSYIFFHWFVLSFVSPGSPINHFHPHLLTLCCYLLLCPAPLSFPCEPLSSHHPPVSRAQRTSAFSTFLLKLFQPSPWHSHSFIWIASTSEEIIH